MKTRIPKKLLAALLALCMLLGVGVISAVADTEEPVITEEQTTQAPVVTEEQTTQAPAAEETLEPEARVISAEEPVVADGPILDIDDFDAATQATNTDLSGALASGLYFKNNEFKILVLGDMDIGMNPYPALMKYIQIILAEVKPDLIVLNGDITSKASSALGTNWVANPWLMDLIKDYPFTLTFGDQDTVLPISKNSSLSRYKGYNTCLAYDSEVTDAGIGNHNLFVYNDEAAAKAKDISGVAFNLWMLDSNNNGFYRTQSAWYGAREYHGVTAQAGYVVPSMMFSHLPLPEIANATAAAGSEEVQGQTPYKAIQGNMFSFIEKYGDMKAVVSGHNRLNAFVRTYNEVDFIQCPGMAYSGSGDRNIRGARLITLTLEGQGVAPETDENGIVTEEGTAPVVSYATKLMPAWPYFDDDNVEEDKLGSQHAFYMAGTSWFFGTQASFYAWLVSWFLDKYEVAFEINQWFGDTFYWLL